MLLLGAYALCAVILVLCAAGKYRLVWIPAAIIWLGLCAFRQSGGGSDLELYTYVFRNLYDNDTLASAMEFSFGWEPSYVALMLAAKRIGIDNPTVFLGCIALFNFAVIARFLVKYAENPGISFLFYLSTYLIWQQFVLARQSIAISLVLIAIMYLIEGKKLRALAFIALASSFHYSAIVCLPFFALFWLTRRISLARIFVFSLVVSVGIALSFSALPLGLVFGYLSQIRDYSSYIESGSQNFLGFTEAVLFLLLLYRIGMNRETPTTPAEQVSFFSADFQARILALMLPVFAIAANFEVFNRFLEYERLIYAMAAGTILNVHRERKYAITLALLALYCAARFIRFYLTFDQGALQDYTIGIGQ